MTVTWKKLAYDADVVKHSLATAINDFLVASGSGAFVKKTLAEVKTILNWAADIATHAALTATHGVAGTIAGLADIVSYIATHAALATGIHGVGASTVESISGSQGKVDTHAALTTTHGAVSTATASKIVVRDASARAKFAAPAASGDALIKGTALTITEMAALTTGKIWQGVANRPSEVDAPPTMKIVRKAADETVNNSNALQNDNELLFAIAANEAWEFRIVFMHIGNDVADFKFAVTSPTGSTIAYGCKTININNVFQERLATASAEAIDNVFGATTRRILEVYGIVSNAGTAGNIQLQWAQNTATVVDTKVLTNSCIIAHKLA